MRHHHPCNKPPTATLPTQFMHYFLPSLLTYLSVARLNQLPYQQHPSPAHHHLPQQYLPTFFYH
jgi:hypothetical protein